ncbi:MAG: hypothetical protein R3D25_16225 [Geminicoccaceae bacterium]
MATPIGQGPGERSGEAAAPRAPVVRRLERLLRWAMPLGLVLVVLALWELGVRWNETPHYILPGPILVARTLVADWHTLYPSLLVTLRVTFSALAVAVIGGVEARRALLALPVGRALALSPLRDPPGDADHRHRPADPDLCREHAPGPADLRLDRRLLSDPCRRYHARAEQRRPQPRRSLPPLRRQRPGRRCASCACRRPCPTSSAGCGSRAGWR